MESMPWPLGTEETHAWGGPGNAFRTSLSLSTLTGATYRSYVPSRVAEQEVVVPGRLAGLLEEATNAITRFDEQWGHRLAPFASLLLRSESVASSRIENLTASARSLGEAELGAVDRPNAVVVVNNVRAMDVALRLADDLTADSILAMHRALMAGTPDDAVAGQWRDQAVWIGTSSVSPVGADYVAPHHTYVPGLIDDLLRFVQRTDVPGLAHAALAHAQFETIHPFTDGNGRTGRVLLHAMLRHRRLAQHVTVPVSAGLLTDVTAYHRALTAFRAGDAGPVLTLTAEAAFRAVQNGTALARDVERITTGWRERITARRDAAVWRVLDRLAAQPVVNAAVLQEDLGLDYRRAKRATDQLEAAGILVAKDKHRMGRLWRAPELLDALDAFAERAGRRQRS